MHCIADPYNRHLHVYIIDSYNLFKFFYLHCDNTIEHAYVVYLNFERLIINYVSSWAADLIAPATMHILCIALRYDKSNKSKTTKVFNLLCLFVKLELQFYS